MSKFTREYAKHLQTIRATVVIATFNPRKGMETTTEGRVVIVHNLSDKKGAVVTTDMNLEGRIVGTRGEFHSYVASLK